MMKQVFHFLKIYALVCLLLLLHIGLKGQAVERATAFKFPPTIAAEHTTYEARDWISIKSSINSNGARFRVDPTLVYDASYLAEDQIPTSAEKTIDTGLPVGTINGSASLGQNGSANYSIPISVPPGSGGFQPSIAIQYNSFAGEGMFGKGWNLSGLSVITRVGRTIYHDGYTGGINFDENDRFTYNGSRLIATNGHHGANGTIYGTEIETFARITSFDADNNKLPEKFLVETKAGATLEFGYTYESRQLAGGSSSGQKIIAWHLNKSTDKNGNVVEYEYSRDIELGSIRLDKIKYANNEIVFHHDYKQSPANGYIAGYKVCQNTIVREIAIRSEGTLIKKYKFRYSYDELTHLNEITEYGKDGKHYKSTIVEWQEGAAEDDEYSDHYAAPTGWTYNNIACDFDGNGRSDLLRIKKPDETDTDIHYDLYRANDPDDPFTHVSSMHDDEIDKDEYQKTLVGDFNGDGYQDAMCIRFGKNDEGRVNGYRGDLMLSNGTTLDFAKDKIHWHEDGHPDDNNYKVAAGDFNGDGITDVIFVQTTCATLNINGTEYYTHGSHIYTGRTDGNFDKHNYILPAGAPGYAMRKMFLADFNGDGLTDVFFLYKNGYRIHINTYGLPDRPWQVFTNGEWWSGTGIHNDMNFVNVGDFNGDGLTDIIRENDSENAKVLINKGDGSFHTKSTSMSFSYDEEYQGRMVPKIADFNGDGISDVFRILLMKCPQAVAVNGAWTIIFIPCWYDASIVYFDVDAEANYEYYGNIFAFESDLGKTTPEIADFNGDGKMDMLYIPSSSNSADIRSFRQSENKHLVTAITDGFNQSTEFGYINAAQNDSYYERGSNGSYPNVDVKLPIYLAHQMFTPRDNGGKMLTYQEYEEAIYNKEGKGFLGFKKVTSVNNTINRRTVNNYKINTDYNYRWLHESITSSSNRTELSRTTNTFDYKDYGHTRFYPYIELSTDENSLTGVSVDTEYDYDDYGNLTHSEVSYPNSSMVITTVNTYTDEGSWCDSRIKTTTTTQKHSADPQSYTRFVLYDYDGDGNLTGITKDNGYKTTHTYTTHGNVQSTTITGADIPPHSKTFQYDNLGRFQTRATDDLGSTSFTYDPGTGNILSSRGIDGLTTRYEYDGFGRLTKTTTPDGNTITQRLQFSSDLSFDNMYYAEKNIPGSPNVKTYYKSNGKEVRTEMDGLNGMLTKDTYYHANGKVERVSDPYYDSETPNWTTYTYDPVYGYLKNHDYNGLNTTCSITGLTATITEPSGRSATRTATPWGSMASTSDDGGSITFGHGSHGNITSATTNTSVIRVQYDRFGNRTDMIDPNAGTNTYTHYVNGAIKTYTNGNGHTYTYIYDQFDRMTTKSGPEGDYIYTYKPSGNGIGQIHTATGPNGFSEEYSYDKYGRVTQILEHIDGESISTSYGYDSYGRVTDIDYNSAFGLHRDYDYNGYLTEVRRSDDNSIIWKGVSNNGVGQYTNYELGGAGLQMIKEYDAYHMPEEIRNNTSTFDMSYVFNAQMKQLTSRTNNVHNLQEVFRYDEDLKMLNRLTSFDVTSSTGVTNTFQMAFESNGNISSKSDVGSYTYPYRKNAIESLTTELDLEQYQTVDYTHFDKVSRVTSTGKSTTIDYGPWNNRKRMINTVDNCSTYYSDAYEKTISNDGIKEVIYIAGGDGLAAAFVKEGSTENMYYIGSDYLGSILAIMDENGTIVEENNFDAWGRKRDAYTGDYLESPARGILTRGFTGHEHLDEYGLINMNGRMYDPLISRFLSPDIMVQAPGFTQSYNRYSYVFNNPLIMNDPSGYTGQSAIGGSSVSYDFSYDYSTYTYSTPDYTVNNVSFSTQGVYVTGANVNYGGYNAAGNTVISYGASFNAYSIEGAAETTYGWSTQGYVSVSNYGTDNVTSGMKSYSWNASGEYTVPNVGALVESYQGILDQTQQIIQSTNEMIDQLNAKYETMQQGAKKNWEAIKNYRYDSPESDWITSIGSIAGGFNGIQVQRERLIRMSMPPIISTHWGPVVKNSKYIPYIGMIGDGISVGMSINNLRHEGATGREWFDLSTSLIGIVPIAGDVYSLMYMGYMKNIDNFCKDPNSIQSQQWLKMQSTGGFGGFMPGLCFIAGSKVLMGDGVLKNIEDVSVGDTVRTYNFLENKLENNVVLECVSNNKVHLVNLELSNGKEITSTIGHPYYIHKKGWSSYNPENSFATINMNTAQLEVGDKCLYNINKRLKRVRITDVSEMQKETKTYNLLRIENSNNYFVNGILVHTESED